ncbi:MAG: hypothetical protein ORN58_05715, partial [Sediminibacterium sp.]|nr:hypothetical protein [Sediminibacterium sp.]
KWYRNSQNDSINGVRIENALNNKFGAITFGLPNPSYYYTIVYNDGPKACDSVISKVSGAISLNNGAVLTLGSTYNNNYTYCETKNGISPRIDISAIGINVNYKWYYQTTTLNGNNVNTAIAVNDGTNFAGTNITFNPSIDSIALGTRYYFVVASAVSGNISCISSSKLSGGISVYGLPRITKNLMDKDTIYCTTSVGDSLRIETYIPSKSTGIVNYTWFGKSTQDTIRTGSNELTSVVNTLYPNLTVAGKTYYYVELSNSNIPNCNIISKLSGGISVFTNPQITSIINTLSSEQSYCINTNVGLLNSIKVKGNVVNGIGTLSYSWYKTTGSNNSNGWLVNSINNGTITNDTLLLPNVDTAGIRRYYAVLDNGYSGVGNCRYTTSNISGGIRVFGKPVITQQPNNTDTFYSINGASQVLNVLANIVGAGTLSYVWNKNNYNTTNIINNSNSSTFLPTTDISDSSNYYVIVSNGFTGIGTGCDTTRSSNSGKIKVYGQVNITVQPSTNTASYCSTTPVANRTTLFVIAGSGGIGGVSYQWYKNTVNSKVGGVLISGANNSSYTPTSSLAGDSSYYYVVVKNEYPFEGMNKSVTSEVSGNIKIYGNPQITKSVLYTGSFKTYCQGRISDSLEIVGNNGGLGTLNYSWYSINSATNSGGNIIQGISNTIYRPSTLKDTTLYYYVVLNNGGPAGCNATFSGVSGQYLVNAGAIITSNVPGTNVSYCANVVSNAIPISIGTPTQGSSISYQWYYDSVGTSNEVMDGQNSTNVQLQLQPGTGRFGTRSYYVIISNTLNGNTCTTTSATSGQITVYGYPKITKQTEKKDTSYCINGGIVSAIRVVANIGVGSPGTVNYQWYKNELEDSVSGQTISGSILDSTLPNLNVSGKTYYYTILQNSLNANCAVTSKVSGGISVFT